MKLPIVTDFPQNDLYLAPINNSDDAPILYGLGLADFLLMAFDPKLLERFLVLLIGRGALYELDSARKQLETQYLRRSFSLAARTLEDDVVEALGVKMHQLIKRGRVNGTSAVVELLCVLTQLLVVGQVFHSEQFTL